MRTGLLIVALALNPGGKGCRHRLFRADILAGAVKYGTSDRPVAAGNSGAGLEITGMWKRDEAVRPPQPTSGNATNGTAEPSAIRTETTRQQKREMVNIGKSGVH